MDFNRFEAQMRGHTPEGQAIRNEKNLPFDDLVSRFGDQARRDIEIGNAWAELSNDILPQIERILAETSGFDTALQIGNRHRRYVEDKGLGGDDTSIAAYITAIAKNLKERKRREIN